MSFLGKLAGGLLNARAEQALAARDAVTFGRDSQRLALRTRDTGLDRTCAAAGCTGGWMKAWKVRGRPLFEGEWGCSAGCLGTLVRSAVRREIGDATSQVPETMHRHRVPLGLVLLAQGWITHPQLQVALEAQKASGEGRIGDWLTRSCGLPEERITRGLGVQWSCPVLALDGFSPATMARVMPKRFVAEFGLVPLRVAGASLLYVAFQDSLNAAAALALEQICGLKVESGLLPSTQFAQARASVLAAEAVPVTMRAVPDADALSAAMVNVLEQKQPVASRLVRVHSYYWMRLWLESGALTGPGSVPPSTEDVEDHVFVIGRSV